MNRTVSQWQDKLEAHDRAFANSTNRVISLSPVDLEWLEQDLSERFSAEGPSDRQFQRLLEFWSKYAKYTTAHEQIEKIWGELERFRTPPLYDLCKLRRYQRDWWRFLEKRVRSAYLERQKNLLPATFACVNSSIGSTDLQVKLNRHFATCHQQHPHQEDFSCVITDPVRETDTMFRIDTIRTIDGYVGQVIYNESNLVVWQDKEAFNEEVEVNGVTKSPERQAEEAALAKRDEVMAELFTDKPFQRAKSR